MLLLSGGRERSDKSGVGFGNWMVQDGRANAVRTKRGPGKKVGGGHAFWVASSRVPIYCDTACNDPSRRRSNQQSFKRQAEGIGRECGSSGSLALRPQFEPARSRCCKSSNHIQIHQRASVYPLLIPCPSNAPNPVCPCAFRCNPTPQPRQPPPRAPRRRRPARRPGSRTDGGCSCWGP